MADLEIKAGFDGGAKALMQKLKRAAIRLPREVGTATKEAGEVLTRAVTDRIWSELPPAWKALDPEYAAWKAKHGLMTGKLKRTGKLVGSIKPVFKQYNVGEVIVADGGYMTNAYYAKRASKKKTGKAFHEPYRGYKVGGHHHSVRQIAYWHETGTRFMPARPIFEPIARIWAPRIIKIYQLALIRTLA